MVFKQEEFIQARYDFINDIKSLNEIEPCSDNLESLHKLILSSVVEASAFIQLADSPNKTKSRLGLSYIANNILNIEESTNKFYSELISQSLTFEKQTIQFEEKVKEIKQKKSSYQIGSNLEAIDREGVLAVCDLKLNSYKQKIENYYKFQADIKRFISYTIFHAKENIKIRKIPFGEASSVEDGLAALSKELQKRLYISTSGLLLVVGAYIYNLIALNVTINIKSKVFAAKSGMPLGEAQALISEVQMLDHTNILLAALMLVVFVMAIILAPFFVMGSSSAKNRHYLLLSLILLALTAIIGSFGIFLNSTLIKGYEAKLNVSESIAHYELINIGQGANFNFFFLVLFLIFLFIFSLCKRKVKEVKGIQKKYSVRFGA